MNTMSISSLWQLFKLTAIVLIVYAILQCGISPAFICCLLLVRLALRLIMQFIGGVIKIAVVFVILWLLTLIF